MWACYMRIQSRIATAPRSREIFLGVGNTGLFPADNAGIPSQSSVREISRLLLTTCFYRYTHSGAYHRSKWRGRGGVNCVKMVYHEGWLCPYSVISSGVSMLYENSVQNHCSSEEWRNLSWGREYRSSLKHRHSHLPERSTTMEFG